MRYLINLLALIGVAALLAAGYAFTRFHASVDAFDPEAGTTYGHMMTALFETADPAEATVWKAKVKDGLTFEDVDQAIKSIANAMNIKDVGELPLGDQVGALQGKPWRKLKIYLYCNPLTAAHMIDFSDAYAAYLPCRVALLEDKAGNLWIYTLNMDMMIYGGKPLPPELKSEALKVKAIIKAVLEQGAQGEF